MNVSGFAPLIRKSGLFFPITISLLATALACVNPTFRPAAYTYRKAMDGRAQLDLNLKALAAIESVAETGTLRIEKQTQGGGQ